MAISGTVLRTAKTATRIARPVVVAASTVGILAIPLGVTAVRAWDSRRSRSSDVDSRDSGLYGAEQSGELFGMVVLGDSLAVGVGADTPAETVGALLAHRLAEAVQRPVELHNFAVAGSVSADLDGQLASVAKLDRAPDVALVIVGGNDVIRRDDVAVSARHLYRTVARLRRMGSRVVVATCPDLGTVRVSAQPLRYYLRRASRRLAAAQTVVVLRAGGRPVSLADTLGPIFLHKPKLMFSVDRFHPSSRGYAVAAAVLLPSMIAAVDPLASAVGQGALVGAEPSAVRRDAVRSDAAQANIARASAA